MTDLLILFIQKITLGYAFLLSDALWLMAKLLTIELVFSGIFYAFGWTSISQDMILKVTSIGFFIWMIKSSQQIATVMFTSFGKWGLKAGANVLTLDDLLDPDEIINLGFQATATMMGDLGGWSVFTNPFSNMVAGLLSIAILLAYFLIALNVFFVIIEFYVFSVCSVILLPFSAFKPVSWLAESAISGLFSNSIRLMAMAFIMSVSFAVLKELSISKDASYNELFTVFFSVGTVCFITINLPDRLAMMLGGGRGGLGFRSLMGYAGGAIGLAGGATVLQQKVRQEGFDTVKKSINTGMAAASAMKRKLTP